MITKSRVNLNKENILARKWRNFSLSLGIMKGFAGENRLNSFVQPMKAKAHWLSVLLPSESVKLFLVNWINFQSAKSFVCFVINSFGLLYFGPSDRGGGKEKEVNEKVISPSFFITFLRESHFIFAQENYGLKSAIISITFVMKNGDVNLSTMRKELRAPLSALPKKENKKR